MSLRELLLAAGGRKVMRWLCAARPLLQQQGLSHLGDKGCFCPIALCKGVVGECTTLTEVAVRGTKACSLQDNTAAALVNYHQLPMCMVLWVYLFAVIQKQLL